MITLAIVRSFLVMGLSLTLLGVPGASVAQAETLKTHSGVIRSINLKARTLAVESSREVLTFNVPTDAEIVVKDRTTAKADLDKLMVGDKVEVKYTVDDTGYSAHRVTTIGLD